MCFFGGGLQRLSLFYLRILFWQQGAKNEELLGKAIKQHGRDKFIIATKFGVKPANNAIGVDSKPETSVLSIRYFFKKYFILSHNLLPVNSALTFFFGHETGSDRNWRIRCNG
jgi:hypothetical protein